MQTQGWNKSSYSNLNGNCVELGAKLDRIRDSKNPNGPILHADVTNLLHAVKTGRFDR